MSAQGVWEQMTPENLLGVRRATPERAQWDTTPGIARSGGPGLADKAGTVAPWHPDSPLFWFGALAAATFGFIAFSTSIRVGPAKASLGVGKT